MSLIWPRQSGWANFPAGADAGAKLLAGAADHRGGAQGRLPGIDAGLCPGCPSFAMRVPSHPVALALLAAFGGPVVAPAPMPPAASAPRPADHVGASLGSAVAMILDGGPAKVGVESTVVSFLDGTPRLLRPGGMARDRSKPRLGVSACSGGTAPSRAGPVGKPLRSPCALRLNAERPRDGEAYLGFGPLHAHGPWTLSAGGDLVEAAAGLFRLAARDRRDRGLPHRGRAHSASRAG